MPAKLPAKSTQRDLLAARRAMLEEAGMDPARIPGGYTVITAIRSRAPFKVGELLALSGEFERELGEDGRKPSKWDLDCEWFGTDYEAAAQRSAELSLGS